jgi:hypothetical protein
LTESKSTYKAFKKELKNGKIIAKALGRSKNHLCLDKSAAKNILNFPKNCALCFSKLNNFPVFGGLKKINLF